jgi:hypothetical protein
MKKFIVSLLIIIAHIIIGFILYDVGGLATVIWLLFSCAFFTFIFNLGWDDDLNSSPIGGSFFKVEDDKDKK